MSMSTPMRPPVLLLYPTLASERARLRLTGPDARRFLHGMVSNDVNGLKRGQGCHATMLTVKGKLLGDLRIYCMGSPGDDAEPGLLIELSRACADKVKEALDRHLIMDDATITDVSAELAQLGVYGEEATQRLLGSGGGVGELAPYHFRELAAGEPSSSPVADLPALFAARSPELGLAGYHVFGSPAAVAALADELAKSGAQLLTPAEFDTRRIEAGTPIYGADLEEDRMPAEANLDDAVSFTKGCYLGQEVVVRLRDRGHLNRRLCGLRFPDGRPAPPVRGTRLELATATGTELAKAPLGIVTSSAQSPRLGTIALAYVHRSAWEPGTELAVFEPSGATTGQKAVVTALPFYK